MLMSCSYCLVDILDLKDRIVSLYDCARLSSDSPELDALLRLASSHDNNAQSNEEEAVSLPTLLFSTQLSTNKQMMTENLQTDTIPTTTLLTAAENKAKVEQTSSKQPEFMKTAKLLLIPGSVASVAKHHSVPGQPHVTQQDSGRKNAKAGSRQSKTGPAKRRSVSDCGQKSVPLADVVNVKSMGVQHSSRSLVSLVPLSKYSPVKSESSQPVKVKLEPGVCCPTRTGKRKLPPEYGLF